MQHELGIVSDDLSAATALSDADKARAGAWLMRPGNLRAVVDLLGAGAALLETSRAIGRHEPVRRMIKELDILAQLSDDVYRALEPVDAMALGAGVLAALIGDRDDERPIWLLGNDDQGRPIRVRGLSCRRR